MSDYSVGYTFSDIESAKLGNNAEREKIILENSGLVWSIVRRFSGRGYETEDLYQIGCIGLIKAIKNFDTSLGLKFSTYAVPMILGEIKRFIRDDGIIKVSRNLKELAIKARLIKEAELKKTGSDITISQLSEKLGVEKEELILALDALETPESLNKTMPSTERELIDTLESKTSLEDDIVEKMALSDAVSKLEERERKIVSLRYFEQKTQMQTANILGISQVQVSRLEKKILKTMRGLLSGEQAK